MQRPSRTRYALLGFLTWRPMSGYDIKKAVEQSTSNFWSESYGQIYPILQDLVHHGLARCTAAPTGGRERRVYTITDKGRRDLRGWLAEPTAPGPVRNEMLLKLFFGRAVGAATHRRQIEALRRQAEQGAAHLGELRALLEANSDQPDAPYWLLTLRFGEIQTRAHLDWFDEALALFDRLESVGAKSKWAKRRAPAAAARTKTTRRTRRTTR